MPGHLTLMQASSAMTADGVRALKADNPEWVERLRRPGSFLEVARELLDVSDEDLRYLGDIPEALQEAIRAAVASAVDQDRPVYVSYAPAYDFEVQLTDFVNAVGIHVRGPYARPYARDDFKGS